MPAKKAEAQSAAVQQLPSKATIRLPAKPAAQPARPLSQRWPPSSSGFACQCCMCMSGSCLGQKALPRRLTPTAVLN